MKATHCSQADLDKALETVNQKYDNNIRFNPDSDGPTRFTLRAKLKAERRSNKGCALSTHYMMSLYPGSIFGEQKKRYTGAACWHVHGDFFDALFEVNPNAVVYSRGNRIDKYYGNWENFEIGSRMYPVYASDCCECCQEDEYLEEED